jgi:hypothetical protein
MYFPESFIINRYRVIGNVSWLGPKQEQLNKRSEFTAVCIPLVVALQVVRVLNLCTKFRLTLFYVVRK